MSKLRRAWNEIVKQKDLRYMFFGLVSLMVAFLLLDSLDIIGLNYKNWMNGSKYFYYIAIVLGVCGGAFS